MASTCSLSLSLSLSFASSLELILLEPECSWWGKGCLHWYSPYCNFRALTILSLRVGVAKSHLHFFQKWRSTPVASASLAKTAAARADAAASARVGILDRELSEPTTAARRRMAPGISLHPPPRCNIPWGVASIFRSAVWGRFFK